jgi:monoamine oxidase
VQRSADFSIAIIGRGFAGIVAAIWREKAVIESFTSSECASEIGGACRHDNDPDEGAVQLRPWR